ncbi:WD40 repeat domain-containing serine/threonine protein kinase [Actinomadura macrotermitis]|uniref:Serine/threonine-protein kinase PknD n=1 Tax=Actinomadura macrotermitis TaxID=2585200 RepID=A0A7K0BS32_9ACTN|nr:serine/threonine-protein kinase [Actinomadura macrotermitis]MQY03692.1 Serine/threonine-protein kinase PknD [Actinomadura macrotermitis]
MIPLRPGDPDRIGPYRITGRLGEGGMGEVLLGESPGGRKVAVKLIRAEYAADARFRARFAREVEAARRVNGFYTAPVVDADADADPPWMVTAYVPGPSLAATVRAGGPLPPHGVRALGAGLAEGLAAIHACGLVHRDLKPGNIIMAADGPRIIDFGIARALDASGMTATGAVLGTLPYMSPEQLHEGRVGPASDLFSLGSVLAFAATGRGPFDASSPGAVVHRISSLRPDLDGVPDDLREIIEGCLAKDPAGRPSPAELIASLTAAPPAPAPVPEPAPAPLPPPPPTEAEPEKFSADRRTFLIGGAGVLTLAGTGLLVTLAHGDIENPNPQSAPASSAGSPHRKLSGLNVKLRSLAFAPDGRVIIAGGRQYAADGHDNAIGQWNVSTGTTIRTLPGPPGGVGSLVFAPDGMTFAGGGEDGTVRIWRTLHGEEVAVLRGGHTGKVLSVAYSRSGRMASAGLDGRTVLWDFGNSGRFRVLERVKGSMSAVAFSPHGDLLAAAGHRGSVQVWDTITGRLLRALDAMPANAVAFSPDGRTLAVGEYGNPGVNGVRLWDTGTWRRKGMLSGPPDVQAVAFSPDGTALAAASASGSAIWVWNLADQRVTAKLSTPAGVAALAYSPDSGLLAAAGDRYLGLWRTDRF